MNETDKKLTKVEIWYDGNSTKPTVTECYMASVKEGFLSMIVGDSVKYLNLKNVAGVTITDMTAEARRARSKSENV